MPEQFMVVHFTEPQAEGVEMPTWHQHVTVVPWAEGDMEAATEALAITLAGFGPLGARVSERKMFGDGKDIPVLTIEPLDAFRSLHNAVLATVEEHSRLTVDRRHTGPKYKPHITQKPDHPERNIGDEFQLDHLTVVRWLDHTRLIYRNVPLAGTAPARATE